MRYFSLKLIDYADKMPHRGKQSGVAWNLRIQRLVVTECRGCDVMYHHAVLYRLRIKQRAYGGVPLVIGDVLIFSFALSALVV